MGLGFSLTKNMPGGESSETPHPSGVVSRLVRPFARFRIGTRLTLCFAVLLGLVAASDLIALWQFSRLSDEVSILYLVDQKSDAVEQIHTDILDYRESLQGLAVTENPGRFASEAERLSETLRRRAGRAKEAIQKPGATTRQDPVLLTMLESIQSTLPGQTAALVALAKVGDWRAVHKRLDTQENVLGKLTASLAGELGAEVGEQRARVLADILMAQRQIFVVLPLTVLLTLVTAGFLSVVVTRTITEPLARLDDAAQALAQGDFSRQVPVAGDDELANLGRVFNNSSLRLSSYYSALQQGEAKFRSYIENSPIGIFVVDRDGRFVDFNQAVAQLLAYEPEILRQITIHRVVPKEHQLALNAFLELPDNGRVAAEWELQSNDGRTIPVTLQGVGLRGGLAMAYLFDLTERRHAEQERERLRGQFLQAQKMESVGRLAGGIAHDFNNLLTVINGYTHLSLSRTESDNPLRAALEQVLQAGERAAALVQQLLAFSRKQVLKQEVVDVNQVVTEISGMASRLMGEDIEVVTQLMPSLPQVLADRHQIGQVLLNLIVNARDAMPQGGTVTIQTEEVWLDDTSVPGERESHASRYVCLVVYDTGVGMDSVTREKLFEPFFTTKDAGKGTGLGLATVQGIILQSGGHITVDSELGKGATFRVYLPATSLEPAAQAAPASSPVAGTERILVVEDQVALRQFVAAVLVECGYQVISAGNAEDALRSLAVQPVDLMLTDLIMPKVGGYELAADANRLYPGLRFLFMSGYRGDLLPAGNTTEGLFLAKPFSPHELAAKVRESLDRAVPHRPV
jgi:two-component system, cell cycle sensor histidine kinase and response regulator CckA